MNFTHGLFFYFQQQRQNIQGIFHFDEYFGKIEVIAKNKDFPARVRFLLQDVIDSRKNFWKPRREKAGPKTIDQIHKEAESEKLNQQVIEIMFFFKLFTCYCSDFASLIRVVSS